MSIEDISMKFDELYHLKANSWQLAETPERKVSVGQFRVVRALTDISGMTSTPVCKQKISMMLAAFYVCSVTPPYNLAACDNSSGTCSNEVALSISHPPCACFHSLLSNSGSNFYKRKMGRNEWCTLKSVMQRPLVL